MVISHVKYESKSHKVFSKRSSNYGKITKRGNECEKTVVNHIDGYTIVLAIHVV